MRLHAASTGAIKRLHTMFSPVNTLKRCKIGGVTLQVTPL